MERWCFRRFWKVLLLRMQVVVQVMQWLQRLLMEMMLEVVLEVVMVVPLHYLLVHTQHNLPGLVFEELLKLFGSLFVWEKPVLWTREIKEDESKQRLRERQRKSTRFLPVNGRS